MKRAFIYLTVVFIASMVVACQPEAQEGVEAKKAQLKSYQGELKALQTKIATLEEAIAAEDPNYNPADKNAALITTVPVQQGVFQHFIEVRGNVSSDRNVTINSEMVAEVVKVAVEKGTKVSKGQVLIQQDTETIQRNIEELETSLELAATRFERQTNLWKKNIGTEMQYLEAKNEKESLERRLASSRSQLRSYRVRAPYSGTVDEVFVKEGEVPQAGAAMLRLVSLEDMYIVADVAEAYLGEFEAGDSVRVRFPSINETLTSTISAVGQVINENNRTFEVRVKLPNNSKLLRPNLLAVLNIKDYEEADGIAVSTNLIQNDNRGAYVFIASKLEDGKLVAEKKRIERGLTYKNKTLVKSGLEAGMQLIEEGAQEVAEGMPVKLQQATDRAEAVSYK